jgi:hypothetical protein
VQLLLIGMNQMRISSNENVIKPECSIGRLAMIIPEAMK